MKKLCVFLFAIFVLFFCLTNIKSAYAMPFYNLQPQKIILRASFSTDYKNSSAERKHNVNIATKKLNNTIVAPNEIFSFNKTVGKRTEKNGYKQAKVIFNGKFVEGIGGGVCQVSTTLYNALLLSGLKIFEYHPHTLQVSYVEPSFDAMVTDTFADLKFINNTLNPIIIKAYTNKTTIKIQILGEPLKYKYITKSVLTESVLPPPPQVIEDVNNEYTNLLDGQFSVYPKNGTKSIGYVIKTDFNGNVIEKTQIRKDYYKPIQGIIIKKPININEQNEPLILKMQNFYQ